MPNMKLKKGQTLIVTRFVGDCTCIHILYFNRCVLCICICNTVTMSKERSQQLHSWAERMSLVTCFYSTTVAPSDTFVTPWLFDFARPYVALTVKESQQWHTVHFAFSIWVVSIHFYRGFKIEVKYVLLFNVMYSFFHSLLCFQGVSWPESTHQFGEIKFI